MRRTVFFAVAVVVSMHVALIGQSPHGTSGKLQPGPNTNAAGGVVNPSDPAALVKADVLLQRQNETVVGASTRNPDHILAAANDYRFVDFPDDPNFGGGQNFVTRLIAKLFRRPLVKPLPVRATGGPVGAWTGVYRSCDRGRTWIGSALPGSPLDNSPASLSSPLKQLSLDATAQGGHAETTDPFIMAGPGGRMHMVVLGFIRFPNGGVGDSRMYYASYTDRNDREGGSCFNYDFTREIDAAEGYIAPGAPTPFIDKPSMAIDKDGAIFISYTVFTDAIKSKIVVARSLDGGATWRKTIPLLNLGVLRNHGTATTVDANGVVYVAWRIFYNDWPLMVVSRSYDRGRTFLPATPISHWWPTKSLTTIVAQLKAARLQPFDQFGDTGPASPLTATARSLAFPSIAAGVVDGQSRLFAVWQERADVDPASPTFGQPSATGSPRIMFTMSSDGGWSWTPRRAIDAGPRPEHATDANPTPMAGPQLQPIVSISGVANPQLVLLYYEARDEIAGGPPYDGKFVSGIGRQVDVRAVRINPVTGALVAPSVQVSQYPILANTDPVAPLETAPGFPTVHRSNLTMYGGGTRAFFGDYPHLIPSNVFERGNPWKWSSEPGSMLAMWTDNRDAQFPLTAGQPDILGNWTTYTPLTLNGSGLPSCSHVATRNANPYFAEIAGVVAGSPQTFKRLNIQRAFVTYVENRTPQDRFFRLTLVPQTGIVPSFQQFSSDLTMDVQVFAYSSRTQTVWVEPNLQNPTGFVRMTVQELQNGAVKPGGLRTSMMLNPDPNNDALTTVPSTAPVPPGTSKNIDLSELHNPQVSAPQVSAFTVKTPQVSAPQVSAPQVSAPQVSALGMPQVSAPQVSAPQVSAPQVSAPQVSATAPGEPPNGTDTTFTIENIGNTETVYNAYLNVPNVEQLLNSGNYQFQVLITRTSLVPGFTQTAAGCVPAAETKVQVIANLQVPQVSAPQISAINNANVSAPQISALATFSVAPEGGAEPVPVGDNQSTVLADQVQVRVRAIRLTPFAAGGPTFNPHTIELEVKSESTNVENGIVQGDDPADAPAASPETPAAPTFLVSNTADSGPGSLRQAILDANANPDANTIFFNISGPRTIAPQSPLPTITSPVVIDGASQPGYQGVPLIELNGANAGSSNGLHLITANSTITGLVINRFTGEGIRSDGPTSTGNVISGNYIGTNAAGSAPLGNSASGIYLRRAGGNFVLGNVVSGNNGFAGIAICGEATFCGGGADSGSPADAAGNVIRGNFVGVAADGASQLRNNGYGISIDGAPNTEVGGRTAGAGNVIWNNGSPQSGLAGVGVFNPGATGNQIIGNSIHFNAGPGIAVADDIAVRPVLSSATQILSTECNRIPPPHPPICPPTIENTVQGSLSGSQGVSYVIDFYSNLTIDPSGFGEGQRWVGSLTVTTPGPFTAIIASNIPEGGYITATATSADGGTSEFSGARMLLPPGLVEWPVYEGGNGHVYQYVRTPGTWTAANAAAPTRSIRRHAGHLATITSAAENAVVTSLRFNPSNDLRGWIGLTRSRAFQWITGEAFQFSNWNAGEPNNQTGDENFVEVFAAGLWNDIGDASAFNQGYVVEYPVDPFNVPPPFFVVTPAATVFSMDGTDVPINGTVTNTLIDTVTGLVIQHYIDQGNLTIAAAGWMTSTDAGDPLGTIPPLTTRTLIQNGHAANAGFAANAGMQPGAAVWRIELRQQVGDSDRLLQTLAIPITLVGTSGGTITSVSPSSGVSGTGFDGFLVVRGTGFPSPASGVAIVSNGASTANGFILESASTTSAYWVRLPGGFSLGAATIQLSDPSIPSISNAFPITVTATPAAPVITNVFNTDFKPTASVNPGGTVYLQADGIDTTGSVVRFEQGDSITEVPSGTATSSPANGLTVPVTVPSGLAPGPVSVSVRQGPGAFSTPVTVTVQ